MAQVDVGDWLYSGDPLRSDRDEIRFLIGDTQSDDQLLSDQEINAAITLALAVGPPAGSVTVSALLAVGAYGLGARSIDLDAATVEGTLAAGDSFVITGNTQRYWVTNTVTAANNTFTDLEFRPGLVAAVADNTAVTVRLFDVREAAALCCESLARRFARDVDVSVDGRSQSFSQRVTAFRSLATELRRQGRRAVPLVRV